MLFMLKITKQRKSVLEKCQCDTTSGCPKPPNFSKTCVDKFYPKSG